MKAPQDWFDRTDWLRLLSIFIALLVSDVVFAVTLLGYSRSSGDIDWDLGFAKLGDLLGDLGNLGIAVGVFVVIVALAIITIEALFPKPVRYVLYALTVILALSFHDSITDALTGMSGAAIIGIAAFLFVKTVVIFLIKTRKEVAR